MKLLAALAILALLVGCGGVPREIRLGVEQLASGTDRADELLTAQIAERRPVIRDEVVALVDAGTIASVEDGIDEIERRAAPMTVAARVLRTVRSALLALERSLDAWDAGSGDGAFLDAAACVVAVLGELAGALDAAEVELPEALLSGAEVLARFAGAACPEPEAANGQ